MDGIGAYDSISRRAMLEGLMQVDGGSATLPFVRMFYGAPSEFCGKMIPDKSTRYLRAKVGCKHSGNTEHWRRQPEHCVQVSSCSPSLIISISSRHPTALEPFTPPSKKHCGHMRALPSTWVRRRCGMLRARGQKYAQFSKEWPAKLTGLPASEGDLKFLRTSKA